MKVYTKTGDKGTTSLVGGKRVPKNHPRVEAYGDIDELVSFIGIVISDAPDAYEQEILRKIQGNLMLVAAHFASDGSVKKMKEVKDEDVSFLEGEIDRMTEQLPPQMAFILPGAPRVAAECHVARTICRRAERHAQVILAHNEENHTTDKNSSKKAQVENGTKIAVEEQVNQTSATEKGNDDTGAIESGIKYLNRLSDYLFVLGRFFCNKSGVPETFWLP